MDARRNKDPETLPWKVSFQDHHQQDKVLAAFRLETSYRDFLAMCYQATVADSIKHLVERACRQTVAIEEAGIEGDVLQEGGKLPYDELLDALRTAMAEVEALKSHRHEYVVPQDATGMIACRICTRSGDI